MSTKSSPCIWHLRFSVVTWSWASEAFSELHSACLLSMPPQYGAACATTCAAPPLVLTAAGPSSTSSPSPTSAACQSCLSASPPPKTQAQAANSSDVDTASSSSSSSSNSSGLPPAGGPGRWLLPAQTPNGLQDVAHMMTDAQQMLNTFVSAPCIYHVSSGRLLNQHQNLYAEVLHELCAACHWLR
jgi:hypothetical protein